MAPCLLEDVYLEFESSGMKIQPLNLDIRNSRDKDDWCQAKVTTQAADHVKDNMVPHEAVNVHTPGGTVWRGWVRTDSVQVGETTGQIQIYDPMTILEQGVVEKEYLETSLRDVVNDIWDMVYDPEGVLKGPEFTTNSTQMETQHPPSGATELTGIGGPILDVQDWLRESLPFIEGEGHFDFRAESPRECFQDICDAFNVQMFTKPDGNFVLGMREQVPNEYIAGTKNPYWKLTRYSLPEVDDPFGAVFVKGQKPYSGAVEGRLAGAAEFLTTMENTAPWAAARMAGYDGPPTTIEYKETSNKEQLRGVAKRYLKNQFKRYNSGTVEVDVLAANNLLSSMGPLKPGDALLIEKDEDCGVPGGSFRINNIQHDMGSGKGWTIKFDVTAIFNREIGTEAWDYNPLNEEMNKGDANDFFIGAIPILALNAVYRAGRSVLDYGYDLGQSVMEGGSNLLSSSADQIGETVDNAMDTTNDFLDDTGDAIDDGLNDAANAVDSFLP